MAKRRRIEVKAEAREDGLELRRSAGGGLVLAIGRLAIVPAPASQSQQNVQETGAAITGERAFATARQVRAFARQIDRLVDSLLGGRRARGGNGGEGEP